MKRAVCLFFSLFLLLALAGPALAATEGEQRVVIGADLSESDIDTVYGQFGLVRGSVPELTVTNAEERTYLEGVMDESLIGHNSISSVYIRILSPNSGLSVTRTDTITWCTEDMYKAALMTAGICDAEVKVAAPFGVSGTAALTGIYKAYESITGVQLQEQAKSAATDELAVTAELADQIDDMDAVAIVSELKLLLNETRNMSDDDLRSQIGQIAGQYGYSLDDETVNRLTGLCRTLEGLSADELQARVEQFQGAASAVVRYTQQAAGFGAKVAQFFQRVADFFIGLF